jgi:hypothetical protein
MKVTNVNVGSPWKVAYAGMGVWGDQNEKYVGK